MARRAMLQALSGLSSSSIFTRGTGSRGAASFADLLESVPKRRGDEAGDEAPSKAASGGGGSEMTVRRKPHLVRTLEAAGRPPSAMLYPPPAVDDADVKFKTGTMKMPEIMYAAALKGLRALGRDTGIGIEKLSEHAKSDDDSLHDEYPFSRSEFPVLARASGNRSPLFRRVG